MLSLYSDRYLKLVEHRGGWREIIFQLYNNGILGFDCNAYLIDLPFLTFVLEKKNIDKHFFMIVHETRKINQDYGYQTDVDKIMTNETFLKNKHLCKGIITFSIYVRDEICKYNLGIPVIKLWHPTLMSGIKMFSMESFLGNTDRKLVFLGSQLRTLYNFYTLNTKTDDSVIEKVWLPGTQKYIDEKLLHLKNELLCRGIIYDPKEVTTKYLQCSDDYDSFISSNIIMIDLFDANANNSVLECIARNLPFFVNKIQPVIEYLGENYPMYFTNKSDISDVLKCEKTLRKLYISTHAYLLNMDKSKFAIKNFCDELEQFILNPRVYNNHNKFAVYFPQFHEILENNKNFYDKFTDYKNLMKMNKEGYKFDFKGTKSRLHNNNNKNTMEVNVEDFLSHKIVPDIDLYNVTDYYLTKHIIDQQVKLASLCNISGFAIYYYWFSHNDIGDNAVMKKVIDYFFQQEYDDDFKVYLNWCNENWTDNIFFVNSKKAKICNEYSEHYLKKNIYDLLKYFTHKNYYKINNKPVFAIHHPHMFDYRSFWKIANSICKQNGFDGITLLVKDNVVNDMKNEDIITYKHHINYDDAWQRGYTFVNDACDRSVKIDNFYGVNDLSLDIVVGDRYLKFVEKELKEKVHSPSTLMYTYNNSARMYQPFKPSVSAYMSDEETTDKMNEKIYESYDNTNSEINKIVLINSWNEWGEDMAIEPSKEHGLKFLNKINKQHRNSMTIVHDDKIKYGKYFDLLLYKSTVCGNILFIANIDDYVFDEYMKNRWVGIIHSSERVEKIMEKLSHVLDRCIGLFFMNSEIGTKLKDLPVTDTKIKFIKKIPYPNYGVNGDSNSSSISNSKSVVDVLVECHNNKNQLIADVVAQCHKFSSSNILDQYCQCTVVDMIKEVYETLKHNKVLK
jgi:hypothetical protein